MKGGFRVPHPERYTAMERHLIATEGCFLEALAKGTLVATNPAQAHFIEVIRGHRRPQNDAESAWIKYAADSPWPPPDRMDPIAAIPHDASVS